MKDEDKTKEQLISELMELRRQVAELEALETERKQAEQALRESEERIHTIVSNAPVVIWALDKEGIFTLSEGAALKSLGLRPGEVVGQSVFDVYCDVPKICEYNRRALAGETVVSTVEVGELVFESHYSPIRDKNREVIGMVGVSTDITERKRAEEALRQSERRFRDIAENALEWIWEVDVNGEYTYASPVCEKILGYKPEELLGKHFYDLFVPEEREQLKKAALETFAKKQPFCDFINQNMNKNGEIVWLCTSGVPVLDERGNLLGYRGADTDITERKQAEEALRESEENFRNSLDNSPLGTRIINAEGKTIYANRAILDIYGCSSIEEFKSIPAVERHTPQSYAERQERVSKREAGKPVPDYFEQSIIRKDGEVRHLEVFNREVLWGGEKQFQLIYHDITERKQAEETLRKSEAFISVLFDSITDFVTVQNTEYEVIKVNKIVKQVFGNDVVGKKCYMVYQGRNEVCPNCPTAKVITNAKSAFSAEQVSRFGQVVEIWASPVKDEQGNIIAVIEHGRDITERKQAEEREKELQKELSLASRLASVGELAAGVAHEINNPLTGILAFSERLLRKSTDKKVRRDLKRVNSEAIRAAKVVERLLTFARYRELKKGNSHVNRILLRALQLRAHELKTGNIEVETDLAPGLPGVMVDPYQIQEVFLSIIMNAEQAMTEADRGGKLGIKTQQVKNSIRTSFTDDGPGISAEDLDKVFDPFFTTREKIGGTGLGLSVCHGIVEGHDGRVYARSKPGKGATFVVELPLTGEKVKEAKRS